MMSMMTWRVVHNEQGSTMHICMQRVCSSKAAIYAVSQREYIDMQVNPSLFLHVIKLLADYKHE